MISQGFVVCPFVGSFRFVLQTNEGAREIDAIINEIANKCEVDTCEIYLANAGEGRKLYIVKNINL